MRARIRTMKPEIHTDEELWDLEEQEHLPLFRGYTGLWNYADREGRFEWRPRALKATILPYWEGDFERILGALARGRFIVKYTVDGKHYGCVRTLAKHQRFDHREPPSELPPPPETDAPGHARAEPGYARVEWKGTEGNGREGVGAERAPGAPEPPPPPRVIEPEPERPPEVLAPVARRSRFAPKDFEPTDEHRVRCQELRFDVTELVKAFKRHEFQREYSDWDRRFAGWIEDERIQRETARANPRASPGSGFGSGSDLDTTGAATAFRPTDDDRKLAKKHDLDLERAVKDYRKSSRALALDTPTQERDFSNRLKCWAVTGQWIVDGALPKNPHARRRAGTEAA